MTRSKALHISAYVIFLLCGMVFPAAGQEMVVGNEAWSGARASGMGGAYAAVADDISAIVYNPAGLAQMRRM